MIQLLTATGARPDAWALCERWMLAQKYPDPVRWIVVDDGPEPQQITFNRDRWEILTVYPSPPWQPGQNTQARNILAGLAHVDRRYPLVMIEDDDWYSPEWLAHVSSVLSVGELVGESHARYYNVHMRRGRQLHNAAHASLCCTGLRGPAIDALAEACDGSPKYIDLALWRNCARQRQLFGGHRVVGIKGLPGRGGIGMGHRTDFSGQPDPDGKLLRSWIGSDAEAYL